MHPWDRFATRDHPDRPAPNQLPARFNDQPATTAPGGFRQPINQYLLVDGGLATGVKLLVFLDDEVTRIKGIMIRGNRLCPMGDGKLILSEDIPRKALQHKDCLHDLAWYRQCSRCARVGQVGPGVAPGKRN